MEKENDIQILHIISKTWNVLLIGEYSKFCKFDIDKKLDFLLIGVLFIPKIMTSKKFTISLNTNGLLELNSTRDSVHLKGD